MQDLFGSVRRSRVFRLNSNSNDPGGSGIAEKIGSCLRKSRVGLGLGLGLGSPHKFLEPLPSPPTSPPPAPTMDETPPIRWRKGELIGCGAFGHVYMGMNLDSGELLAIKQVLIGTNSASKEKAQAHIRELEEEVNLLKNLSHPNIVRYMGTIREEGTLNILLEFVPGGSISSLLGKFGSFPEAVIRTYTEQILQGLEYLHRNGIMHRDIKGANILVDNKGCIKLADFGASKQVAKLATMNAAKSMKGTPYWMAPEVILQTGHCFSADIWSVGCTVIEMATGKPPWSEQYQEVAALFHIGTTKSHPPIPEHLSLEAQDFLLKCLQKEPNSRHTALDLLQHPFVRKELQDKQPLCQSAVVEPLKHEPSLSNETPLIEPTTTSGGLDDFKYSNGRCSTTFSKHLPAARSIWEISDCNDMCKFDDTDDFPALRSSFNPMQEPYGDWPGKFDSSPEQRRMDSESTGESIISVATYSGGKLQNDLTSPCEPVSEDDDEVTESKIRAFLDEKALDLKKLQTPLYEEFFNGLNNNNEPCVLGTTCDTTSLVNSAILPPKKSRTSFAKTGCSPSFVDTVKKVSPERCNIRVSTSRTTDSQALREIPSRRLNEWGGVHQDTQQEPTELSDIFSERRRKWKEELDQELEREREMRQAVFGKASSSPISTHTTRKRDRLRFTSPGQ